MGSSSLNAAESHLQALARKGAIRLEPGRSRGIRLPEEAGLPLVGRVAAGSPLLAVEHIEGHWRIDPAHFQPRADYLLRVRGQSMRDAGILDGDLLARARVARPRARARRWSPGSTTRSPSSCSSRAASASSSSPATPTSHPIVVDPARQSFCIEGIGVGVLRDRLG
jgi:repressor LexA